MLDRNDLFLEVCIREREAWARRFAAERMLLRAPAPARPHSLRARLGFSLIQAGRALLRHRPPYPAGHRRLA